MQGPGLRSRIRLLSSSMLEVVMAAEPWRVSDRLWREVEPLLPRVERRFWYPGRKRVGDRACLEGVLYVLRHGMPWRALPRVEGFPSCQACCGGLGGWGRGGGGGAV